MKTTLIIGASSATAVALAEKLSSLSHRLLGISRNKDISSHYHTFYHHDILSDESLPKIEEPIHSLVYFPGSISLKPFKGTKKEDILHDFEINVLGAVKCIQHYLPQLQQVDNASIVLYSTVAVQLGMPFHSSISISKGAIEGLTRSLAAELAPKIRVNCIAPSLTNTPLANRLLNTPEKSEAAAQRHPLKKIGQPEDLASATAFLLSDESSWMSGQILKIDGGMSTLKTN